MNQPIKKMSNTAIKHTHTGDYDVSSFTYDVESKTFSAEARSLGWVRAPKHIMLKGSSKRVLYVRQATERGKFTPDTVFYYVPTKNSLDWTPGCIGTKIKVFNT